MSRKYYDIAFTPSVQEAQVQYGSRAVQDRVHHVERSTDGDSTVPPEVQQVSASHDPVHPAAQVADDAMREAEREFISERDGFYLATISGSGWPYVQYRGGPAGFVTTPDEHTISWPDFRGNRQYISTGNLETESRVAIFFMDYARQVRLKVFGSAQVRDVLHDPEAARALQLPHYPARIEREISVRVNAFDWNCPQHITPRYTPDELKAALDPLHRRLKELEQENARLRSAATRTASRHADGED